MIVASSRNRGKTDVLVDLARELGRFVERTVREGGTLDECERGVWERLLEIGHAAADWFLKAQGDGDLGQSILTEEGTMLQRSDTVVTRSLRTVFGEHAFKAYVYSQGAHRKIELRPIDARINLPEGKASYLLQEFSQLFCVEKAFGVGAWQFDTVFGQRLSVDVLEHTNRDMGDQADRFLDQLSPPPRAEEGEVLVATNDNKGVPLVREDARQVPVFEEKERPGNRRMASLGCVYTVDRHVRTPEQIVAALFRDSTMSGPREDSKDRPKPCAKRYRGYFADPGHQGKDAVPSAYRTWAWLAQEVQARRQSGQPVVRLMDGQPILWDAADACLEDFVEELRATRQEHLLIDILDIIHVSGYVWRAAKALHTHKEHQEAFAYERLLRILRGDVRGVVRGLRRMASERGLTGTACKEIHTVCNYFMSNAHRMRYDEYLQAGYPIATGVIEGACRHVIKDRMEQGGMRWTLAGAEAMLHVRAVCASSEWETFGRWRQDQEAQRLHAHRTLVENYEGFSV